MEQLREAARRFLTTRRQAYITAFEGIPGEKVLADLAKFCRAHGSTGHPDPYMAARMDGRREVWLRIQEHLNLSDEDLWKLRGVEKEPR